MQEDILKKCIMCPHKCGVNRLDGKTGVCKATDKIKVALVSTHNYEEPCISGDKGSGTIFFTGCNLKCVYCQNYEISDLGNGKEITIEEGNYLLAFCNNIGPLYMLGYVFPLFHYKTHFLNH